MTMDLLLRHAEEMERAGQRLLRLAALFRELAGEETRPRRRRRRRNREVAEEHLRRGPGVTLATQTAPRLGEKELKDRRLAYTTEEAV